MTLLVRLGAHLWQATKDDEVKARHSRNHRVVEKEMTSPAGGFYSSLDATAKDTKESSSLERSRDRFASRPGLLGLQALLRRVTKAGNFEGSNILFVPSDRSAVAGGSSLTRRDLDAVLTAHEIFCTSSLADASGTAR